MNDESLATTQQLKGEDHVSFRSYAAGFVLSLALTVVAYTVVTHGTYSTHGVMVAVATLAITQFIVQMLFFMHLGSESRPRWRLAFLIFMLGIVAFIVFGSIWIMDHLNYNMMEPHKMQEYLDSQDSL